MKTDLLPGKRYKVHLIVYNRTDEDGNDKQLICIVYYKRKRYAGTN